MSERPPPTDGELWRSAATGDGEAFGLLFDRHCEAVRTYCARRTGSLDAADDLVSMVFLEAWRRRDDVELHHDQALPWLYGVARRIVQQRWRSAVRHRRALSRVPATAVTDDHADGVAARVDDQEQLRRVGEALDQLRPAEREVLLLCVWQELDYVSASIALGIPVGTVRSRLSRARARLRAIEEGHGPAIPPTVPHCAQENR